MIKRYLAGGAVAALVFLAVPTGANAGAAINGTGHTHCHVTGTIKFKPGLVLGGTAPLTTSSKTALSSCTGDGDGAHVISASSSSTTTDGTNACPTPGAGPKTINTISTVKWKVAAGTPKLNTSTVNFTLQSSSGTGTAGDPIIVTLSGTVTGGSFQGNSATTSLVLDQSFGDFVTACTGKGLKAITFTGINGVSTSN